MKKLVPRLFVAGSCLFLGVALTNLVRPLPLEQPTVFVCGGISEMGDDERRLREIYREYALAYARHQRGFFEQFEAPDYFVTFRGLRLSKEQDIRIIMDSPSDAVYERRIEYLKIFGDTAAIKGRTEARYSNGFVYSCEFLDTWAKSIGMWQLQSTRLIN